MAALSYSALFGASRVSTHGKAGGSPVQAAQHQVLQSRGGNEGLLPPPEMPKATDVGSDSRDGSLPDGAAVFKQADEPPLAQMPGEGLGMKANP